MKPNTSNILVINGGSSSIKFAIYRMSENPNKVLSGQIKRIGLNNPSFTFMKYGNAEINQIHVDSKDFERAAEFLMNWLNKENFLNVISGIGHRIVHGMEQTHPEIINDDLLKELNRISEFDPNHLPTEILIIKLFKNKFPIRIQVACFDTSFHTTMPHVAKILPIPRRFDELGIRRYGFHGLSFAYLIEALNKISGGKNPYQRLIFAHLGSGASLAAIKDGKSIDTAMELTPAGGLVMGTRPRNIDPGVAWYIIQSEKMTPVQFNHLINHESGLPGASEISADMLDLLKKENSDIIAAEALSLFCCQVKKWIGSFAAALSGMDILVFSGGIGENAPEIDLRISENLDYLGIEINGEENKKNATIISPEKSRVKVYVIPTDEETVIAKETKKLFFKY